MGLRMDEMHAPTVPSGPTTGPDMNGGTAARSLNELIASKESLEAQLSALGAVLDSHGVNMNTSLISFDGYPRADIDVAQIRTTRAQIIRLKNDYKALMNEIEKAVHEQFATRKSTASDAAARQITGPTPASASNGSTSAAPAASVEPPFARVNKVTPGSPASDAGLQAGDNVTKFGYVNWTNHEKLSKVAQVVQQNESRQILVKIMRGTTHMELRLTPRKDWGGRGMLGCHLLPI